MMTAEGGRAPMTETEFMRRAIAISERTMAAGTGGPFGAVITRDGAIIAEGRNAVTSANDPTAHAEIMAIREACRALDSFSLAGCEIYTSCEPCPMCLSAIYWARIGHIHYANSREDAAGIGFDDAHIYDQIGLPIDARSIPASRVLADEAAAAFRAWREKPDKVPY